MSERYSPTRDLTAALNYAIPTGPHLLLYLCNHKGLRLGGEWQGRVPMRCPMCVHQKAKPANSSNCARASITTKERACDE